MISKRVSLITQNWVESREEYIEQGYIIHVSIEPLTHPISHSVGETGILCDANADKPDGEGKIAFNIYPFKYFFLEPRYLHLCSKCKEKLHLLDGAKISKPMHVWLTLCRLGITKFPDKMKRVKVYT